MCESDSQVPVCLPTSSWSAFLGSVALEAITAMTSPVAFQAPFGPRLVEATAAMPSRSKRRAIRPTVLRWTPKAEAISTSLASPARDNVAMQAASAPSSASS